MITKTEATEIMLNYYNWEQKAQDFMDIIDNNIRYAAQSGLSEIEIDIPNDLTDESLNMVLFTVDVAGFDVEINATKHSLIIKWSNGIGMSV